MLERLSSEARGTRPSSALSSRELRRIILEESRRANVGHIGSALSVADILAALYGGALRTDASRHPDRDRFVLSKGHAALALYAALHLRGVLSREELATYCGDGSLLGVHPEHQLPGVDFTTGSLGHGLTVGAGSALAARLQKSARRIFVLVSDAELNEGSLWEAVMFASHHRLENLVAIVDANGQQALGYTEDVLSLSPLSERFRAFGWEVVEVDGHDVRGLERTFTDASDSGLPRVVIAATTFGKGVSFMESRIEWHYLPMSDEQYRQALAELEAEGQD